MHGGGSDHRELLLVVGCPRSGTTWVQLLLAQHPLVATANETHVFVYLDLLHRRWMWERERVAPHRPAGLSSVLSPDEFYGLCRDVASRVLHNIARSRPEARVVLEKTPGNVERWELILKLFPEARFVHVIRDPRGVAASVLSASRTWGRGWAPGGEIGAVSLWRSSLEAGRRLAATGRCLELRYRDLVADTQGQLRRIFDWLGLEADEGLLQRAVAACGIENLRGSPGPAVAPWPLEREPEGFFRRGEVDAWRRELSGAQVRTIEYLAGGLMQELGYELAFPRSTRRPLRLLLHDWAEGLRWRSERVFRRLGA